MRDFCQVQRELSLVKLVGSANGNLFIVPVAPGAPRLVVRRFDRDLPASLVPAYVSLLRAAASWVDRAPELARVVRVGLPTEVGADFVATAHVLATPLWAYFDDEDPPEPPDELPVMQARFRARAAAVTETRDLRIAEVLARSILEPSGKTFYILAEDRFIVADIKPTRAELELWETPCGAARRPTRDRCDPRWQGRRSGDDGGERRGGRAATASRRPS